MVKVWIILVVASCAVTVSAVSTSQKRINHGDYLTLELPERTQKLEFTSANEENHETIWQNTFLSSRASKGVVYANNKGWTFRMKHTTFDDEGTYTLLNSWNHVISSYRVKVETKRSVIERVPGETLTIYLEGIPANDATLRFYSNSTAVTLVENGAAVGNSHPDYINRVKVSSDKIQVLNVNVSDLGTYKLRDHKSRPVSNTTMILVENHSFTPNKGLLALLLLGIPGSICFCCRRRLCKCCRGNKSETANPVPESVPICHPVTTDPTQGNVAGYPTYPGGQNYPSPGQGQIQNPPPGQGQIQYPPPGQGQVQYPPPDQGQIHYPPPPQWNGQPAAPPASGFNPEYAPQNPVYPPAPGVSPIQPPQWSGPPNQYNPPAPVDYSSMMNTAPSVPQPPTFNINVSSPAPSSLNPQPEFSAPGASIDILNSSGSTDVQFKIDKSKSSTNNFL